MTTLKLSNGMTVSKKEYVTAKTKDLKSFGYNNLTENEVSEQVDLILSGGACLSVIGMFCIDDIELD